MGLTITAKYENAPHYDMGAISFMRLRNFVADCVAEEFGEHYSQFVSVLYQNEADQKEYDRKTHELISKYRIPQRVVDFLYAPDTEYGLSPAKCAAVLKVIRGIPCKEMFGYGARPQYCLTMQKFAEMLSRCVETKTYLYWC